MSALFLTGFHLASFQTHLQTQVQQSTMATVSHLQQQDSREVVRNPPQVVLSLSLHEGGILDMSLTRGALTVRVIKSPSRCPSSILSLKVR